MKCNIALIYKSADWRTIADHFKISRAQAFRAKAKGMYVKIINNQTNKIVIEQIKDNSVIHFMCINPPFSVTNKLRPFYEQGKLLKELGECLMNPNTKIDEITEKAFKCGFKINFRARKYSNR